MASTIGIDVGGTLTDFCGCDDDTGALHVHKMASTADNPAWAIIDGLREICAQIGVDFTSIAWLLHTGWPSLVLDVKLAGISVRADERIVIESPSAGGYGAPAERDPEKLVEGYQSDKFSARDLREHYGYVPRSPDADAGRKKEKI